VIDDKVQLILDRQSIRDTLFRHAAYCDEADLSRMDEIWAPEACRDNGAGHAELVGRDAMMERLASGLAKYNWTHHHLGESRIDIDGDQATAMTYVACWHESVGGERFWGTARYYDQLRRADGGRWLITHRRMIMTGAEGSMEQVDAAWLNRRLPTGNGRRAETSG